MRETFRTIGVLLLCAALFVVEAVAQVAEQKPGFPEVSPASQYAEFLRQLDDPTVSYIRCPAGEWKIAKSILVRRSNVTVDFSDAVLIPVDGLFMPIRVLADVEQKEWHANGIVDETVQEIVLQESMPVAVGDIHRVGIGVNYSDPNESQYVAIRKVIGTNGIAVRYDSPFGIRATEYESFEALAKLSGYPVKVGPWGPGTEYGSQQKRGLGQDHGIRRIVTPTDRVVLINPHVRWPVGSRMYGAWAINLYACRGCVVVDAVVENVCGSAVHLWWCEQCVVSGLDVSGDGGGQPWGHSNPPRVTDSANSVSAWGAVDCKISRVRQSSTNTSLMNFEAGSRGIDLRDCDVTVAFDDGVRSAPQLGVYGPGRVRLHGLRINGPVRASSLFPGWVHDVTVDGIELATEQAPDWISPSSGVRLTGPLTWGAEQFAAPETVEFEFVPTKDGFVIPYPDGVVLSAEFHVSDWSGIRNLNVTNNYTATTPQPVKPSANSYTIRIGATYPQYREQLALHRVWIERGATVQPIKCVCRMMRKI